MNPARIRPAQTMVSGVTIIERDPVKSIVETIERLALQGGSPAWAVADLLPLLTRAHWDAYAREARVPTPDDSTIKAVIEAYKKHVGAP